MTKSYVTVEQAQCPVCLDIFDTGAILMDRQLKPAFEVHTMTHHAPCAMCRGNLDTGFVALIESDAQRNRTGRYAWIDGAKWGDHFNVPKPPQGIAFVEEGVLS